MRPSNVLRLVDGQARARERVNAKVERAMRTILARTTPDTFYSDARVNDLAEELAVIVRAGHTQTARVTDAYLAATLTELIGRRVDPAGIAVDSAALRNGITPEQAYARLGPDFRFRVSEGATVEAAGRSTTARALAMATADTTLAMREAARQSYTNAADVYRIEVSGYRRVIHPETTRGGTCGLCAAASDRVYRTEDLLPIHAGCCCETLPIVNDRDPGRSLNQNELGSLYDEAGSTDGKALHKVRVQYNEHGELGPVLTDADQNFRGPNKIPDTPLTIPDAQVA